MCARRRGQQGSQPTTCCVIRPVSSDRGPGFEAPLASLAAVSADIAGARAGFEGGVEDANCNKGVGVCCMGVEFGAV